MPCIPNRFGVTACGGKAAPLCSSPRPTSAPCMPISPACSASTYDPGSQSSTSGRLTIRFLHTSCELTDYLAPTWPAAAQVFQLQRVVHQRNHATTETVYGLTTLTPAVTPPAQLLHHIRRYWEIENRLHWRRKVTLGEDPCTVRRGHTLQVLAALNNAILALADRLQIVNLAAQRRIFAARPDEALRLLLQPI